MAQPEQEHVEVTRDQTGEEHTEPKRERDVSSDRPSGAGVTPWEFLKHFSTVATTAIAFVLAAIGYLGFDRLSTIEDRLTRQIEVLAGVQLDKQIKSRDTDISEMLSKFEADAQKIIKKVEDRLRPFEWLAERKEVPEQFADVGTIAVAHKRIQTLFMSNKPDLAIRLANRIIELSLPGSSEDYFNLGTTFATNDQIELAAKIVEIATVIYPDDVDLLASTVKYLSDMGDFEKALAAYEKLKEIDREHWTWRAFDFVADYLIGTNAPLAEVLETYKAFREELPHDERGYSGEGMYWYRRDRYVKAAEILEEAMSKCQRTAQSGLLLAQINIALGAYEDAIEAVDRAIESNAEDQPSVNSASLFWYRAAALDSWVHRDIRSHLDAAPDWKLTDADDGIIRRARDCVVDYDTAVAAIEPNSSFSHYMPRMKVRLRILRGVLTKSGATAEILAYVFGDESKEVDLMGNLAEIPPDVLAALKSGDEHAFDVAIQRLDEDERRRVLETLLQLQILGAQDTAEDSVNDVP